MSERDAAAYIALAGCLGIVFGLLLGLVLQWLAGRKSRRGRWFR